MTFLSSLAHGRPDRFLALTRHDTDHEPGFTLRRSEREAIVRASIIAGVRGGRTIDEGDIRHILTQTVDQRGLSVTDMIVRAAAMAQGYSGQQAFNWRSATPDQIARYLAGLGLEPGWRRALRREEERRDRDRDRGGSDAGAGVLARASYSEAMRTAWSSSNPGDIHDGNWHNSPFAGVHGLNVGLVRSLMAAGVGHHEIVSGARHVQRLGISTPENIARAARLEQHAPGFMGHMQTYYRDLLLLRRDQLALADAETRLAWLRADGRTEEAAQLEAQIVEQRRLLEQRTAEVEGRVDSHVDGLSPELQGGGRGIRGEIRERVDQMPPAEIAPALERHDQGSPQGCLDVISGAGLGAGQVDARRIAVGATVVGRQDVADAQVDEFDAAAAGLAPRSPGSGQVQTGVVAPAPSTLRIG